MPEVFHLMDCTFLLLHAYGIVKVALCVLCYRYYLPIGILRFRKSRSDVIWVVTNIPPH